MACKHVCCNKDSKGSEAPKGKSRLVVDLLVSEDNVEDIASTIHSHLEVVLEEELEADVVGSFEINGKNWCSFEWEVPQESFIVTLKGNSIYETDIEEALNAYGDVFSVVEVSRHY